MQLQHLFHFFLQITIKEYNNLDLHIHYSSKKLKYIRLQYRQITTFSIFLNISLAIPYQRGSMDLGSSTSTYEDRRASFRAFSQFAVKEKTSRPAIAGNPRCKNITAKSVHLTSLYPTALTSTNDQFSVLRHYVCT